MALKEDQIRGVGLFLMSIGVLIIGYTLLKDINDIRTSLFAAIFVITGIVMKRTTNKKLFYALCIIVVLAILVGTWSLVNSSKRFASDAITIGPVIVKQSGGSALLISECADRDYIGNRSDYIIEGTVKRVESRWNDGGTDIFTYTDLAIEKYVKGTPFTENTGNELTIITPGGTVGEITEAVEDQPIFYEGKRVRIYLKETNGEFSIVCAQRGVEET